MLVYCFNCSKLIDTQKDKFDFEDGKHGIIFVCANCSPILNNELVDEVIFDSRKELVFDD